MSIYEKIKQDHDKHRDLLSTLQDTTGNSERRKRAWKKFYYDVKAHAAAEEEVLYSKLIATQDGQPDARHSVHEHQVLDKLLDELNEADMSSSGWLNRFRTLKHDYLHHIEEEERDIFPRSREELGADSSSKLAAEFSNRKREEIDLVEKKTEEALQH